MRSGPPHTTVSMHRLAARHCFVLLTLPVPHSPARVTMTSIKSESPTPSDISFKEEPESDSYEPPTKKTKGRVSRQCSRRTVC